MNTKLINTFTKNFNVMKKSGENLFLITITNLKTTKCEAYRSIVRSNFITPIKKYCISQGIGFDGIIAIEYNPDLCKPIHRGFYTKPMEDLGTHAHLIISTKLDLETIKGFRDKVFPTENIKIDDITKRDDLEYLPEYLMKQSSIITESNFLFDLRPSIKIMNEDV